MVRRLLVLMLLLLAERCRGTVNVGRRLQLVLLSGGGGSRSLLLLLESPGGRLLLPLAREVDEAARLHQSQMVLTVWKEGLGGKECVARDG